jgi:hypothetical protein
VNCGAQEVYYIDRHSGIVTRHEVFKIDGITEPEIQETTFHVSIAKRAIHRIYLGVNQSILSIGPLNTGKSFTTIKQCRHGDSLVEYCVARLLSVAADDIQSECSVKLAAMGLNSVKNQIYDFVDTTNTFINVNLKGEVEGATEVFIKTLDEAQTVLRRSCIGITNPEMSLLV